MRHLKWLVLFGAVVALAPMAWAGSGTPRATGGGQYLVSTGAGSTIAFVAQGTPDGATGQVQEVARSGGTGQGGESFHGIVTCLLVSGNFADIEGHERGSTNPFTLYALDGGEGAPPNGDMIMFSKAGNQVCDETNPGNANQALARGNVQVYDGS